MRIAPRRPVADPVCCPAPFVDVVTMPAIHLILTAPSDTLTPSLIGGILDRLSSDGANPQIAWLKPDAAAIVTVPFDDADRGHAADHKASENAIARVQTIAAEVSASHGIDANVMAEAARPSKLLIADMESTIIEQEMLDELADTVGLREKVEGITAAAMRGELDFASAITERVALLKGLDASVLNELIVKRLTYMPGAKELVQTMKSGGAYCALVSGGFTHFTAHVANELGFDEHRANTLEVADGKLTGRVIPPILGRKAKLAALVEIAGRLKVEIGDAIAVGDGANDLAMLEAAGLGVAFRAKPQVRDAMAIHATGAVISHCDLTALLYLQGRTHADFAAART